MYQAGGTIKDLLDKVAAQEYILPAIQREFVWKPEQICQLFDSLLQGYPFGTFLFWKIKPENTSKYQFYDFIRDFHQRDAPHCAPLDEVPDRECVAVLDGQQRMTSLNIGLRGSYSWKLSGKWWNNKDAFPERKLYLDLVGEPDTDTTTVYQFEFLTDEKANEPCSETCWFRVARIMDEDVDDLTDALDDLPKEQRDKARKTLRHLYRIIHDKDKISFYEETEQSLDRVLNIFIRMNSGGTPLSYSDLLLSIAVAQWGNLDAREAIHSLVDEMNQIGDGFSYSKDLVLKAGLMLSDIGSVGFKVENFNKENMTTLESNWDGINNALLLAVRLLASFGFNGQNLRADSSLLPVAYYIYFRGLEEPYLSRSEYANDREALRHWLIKSLLKASGIWGSGLDTLLTGIRATIQQHGSTAFPVDEIEQLMSTRGKSLRFSEEEIQALTELEYGDKRTFALLSVLFGGFNFSHHFHVDHIYPKSRFTRSRLIKADVSEHKIESFIKDVNKLANLQLLEGSINNEKRQKMPHEWYAALWPDKAQRTDHLHRQAIVSLPTSLDQFDLFYSARKKVLESRIRNALEDASAKDNN